MLIKSIEYSVKPEKGMREGEKETARVCVCEYIVNFIQRDNDDDAIEDIHVFGPFQE